ncbi:MAG: two pore domain potassium channel family protein [Acidobacteria bacterium]|nr:two pore domain potassium channel family protein [Acidobacteriota bacterium]
MGLDQDAHAAYADLSSSERRRVITHATLRTALSLAVIIIVFIIVPAGDLASGTPGLGLTVGVVLIVGMIALELFRTVRDPYPEVRAATSLFVLVALLVTMFALTYAAMSVSNPAAFTEPLDKSNAIYFTVTTLSTTGFGDIAANSPTARWVVTVQMLFDLIAVVGLARVFVLAAKAGRARRTKSAAAGDSGGDASS